MSRSWKYTLAFGLIVPIAMQCQSWENDWTRCAGSCESFGTELRHETPGKYGLIWHGAPCPEPCPCADLPQSTSNRNRRDSNESC